MIYMTGEEALQFQKSVSTYTMTNIEKILENSIEHLKLMLE